MTDSLRIQCELLAENLNILKKNFKLENKYTLQVVASIYASCNALADPEKIKDTLTVIKTQAKPLSVHGRSASIALAALLSLETAPKATLAEILDRYKDLKKCLGNSRDIPYSAYLLVKYKSNIPSELIKEYLVSIKAVRSFIHLGGDSIFATLFALYGKKPQYAASDIKAFSDELSDKLPRHSAKAVANIFAFGERRGYVDRFNNIAAFLKADKCSLGKGYEAALLAPLALLDHDEEKLSDMIVEIYDHIEKNPDFSASLKGKQRTLYAAFYLYRELTKKSTDKALTLAADAAFYVALSSGMKLFRL